MVTSRRLVGILISIVIVVSCRKADNFFQSDKPQSETERRFFSSYQSTDTRVQSVQKFVMGQNAKFHFVDEFVDYAGFAIWNKSRVYTSNSPGARTYDGADSTLVFTPLVRSDSAKVSSVLLTKLKTTDTTFKILYDWQYPQFGFDSEDGAWQANEFFTLFALLNDDVFDYKSFEVLDERLLHSDIKDDLDSLGLDADSVRIIYTLPLFQSEVFENEICTQWTTCIQHCYAFKEPVTSESACCATTGHFEECWELWPVDLGYWEVSDPHEGGGGGGWEDPCDPLNQRSLPCGGGGWEVIPLCDDGIILEETCLTQDNYPGKDDGFPWLWWENDTWLDNNFHLDIDEQYPRLTAAERNLLRQLPVAGYKMFKNFPTAISIAEQMYPGIYHTNTKLDAFRHAFYHFLNVKSDIDGWKVQAFADAHETEVPSLLQLEKQMDLFNNHVGISMGISNTSLMTLQQMANFIAGLVTAGNLKYLKPLDFVTYGAYDANFDGVQDCSTCTNGIGSTTALVWTNQ